MNFCVHKLLTSGSGNRCFSIGASFVASCNLSTGHRQKTLVGGVFCFGLFFPPSPSIVCWGFQRQQSLQAGQSWGSAASRAAFSSTLSNQDSALGSPSPPNRATEGCSGSLPPARLPAGSPKESRVLPFHGSPASGSVLPFARQDLLTGAGGQTSQPRILRNGERSSLLGFVGHWLSYGCPSSPTLFLWFSLLFS